MFVFVEGGKLENLEKNPRSKTRANNKFNPHVAPARNRSRATLVGGERSHHCINPAPRPKELWKGLRYAFLYGVGHFFCRLRIKLYLFLPYNKHLINRAKSVCMGES